MNPFRGYLKIKVKEGELKAFQSLVPSFIEKVKETEPNALQFEAFSNEERGEIIWLESYVDNTGFDFHISNPVLDDLKMKMMPLQESIVDMHFMSAPTNAALAGLQQYGISPNVLSPFPGTNRLMEGRVAETNIQIALTMELSDVTVFSRLNKGNLALAPKQEGLLFHQGFQIDKNRIIVYQEYKDSETLLSWLDVTDHLSQQLFPYIKGLNTEFCGNPPSPALKEKAAQWDVVYFDKIAGFKRFA